jgi:hypothetical protein
MAELTTTTEAAVSSCCVPEAQATCCEPSVKAECCGHGRDEDCRCSADKGADAARERAARIRHGLHQNPPSAALRPIEQALAQSSHRR